MNSQTVLEKLFDSPAKLRLMKLFLRNPEAKFTTKDIRQKTLLATNVANTQLKKLVDIKLVKVTKKRGSSEKIYELNPGFIFLRELQNLILMSSPADQDKVAKKIRSLGRIRLAVLSGIFFKPDREDMRTDIFLVGDGISEKKLSSFIQNLEAESGTEIYYTVLTSEEFNYRYKMFDRFILDIVEKPHKKLINKLNL